MKNKIIAALGIVAVIIGTAMLCGSLAPIARYNGTTPVLVAMPFVLLYPLLGLLISRRR